MNALKNALKRARLCI